MWLDPADAVALLASVGVEAAPAAERLGWPVALQAGSGDIVHKTEVGAVRLGLSGADDLRAAWASMEDHLGPAMGGAVVQRMVDPGVETIVGVVHDQSFGPLVMFGMGGTAVELLGDRAFRVVPLTDVDAAELVRAPRGAPLLQGYRGAPAADVAALEELLRVARLADELPEVAEVDLNPVIVSPRGAVVVDAKVRLAAPAPPGGAGRRAAGESGRSAVNRCRTSLPVCAAPGGDSWRNATRRLDMGAHVLVAYGSRHGSTAQLAAWVGEALRERGLAVTVSDATMVDDVEPYDAVVVGGALYAMHWHGDARRFVRRHARALRRRAVWFFSSGPLDDSANEGEIPPVRGVRRLAGRVGARGHVTFGGRLDPDVDGVFAQAMAKKVGGDWRDREQVRRWAMSLAAELQGRVAA